MLWYCRHYFPTSPNLTLNNLSLSLSLCDSLFLCFGHILRRCKQIVANLWAREAETDKEPDFNLDSAPNTSLSLSCLLSGNNFLSSHIYFFEFSILYNLRVFQSPSNVIWGFCSMASMSENFEFFVL